MPAHKLRCAKNMYILRFFILQKLLWNLTLVILRVNPGWIGEWRVGASGLWSWAHPGYAVMPIIPFCLDPSETPPVALSAETLHTAFLSGVSAPHQDANGKPADPQCARMPVLHLSLNAAQVLMGVGHGWARLSLLLLQVTLPLLLNTLHPFTSSTNP